MITIGDTPLENGALRILAVLEAKGFQAYFVGGYVRDKLIGRAVHDIDIATSAHPEDVLSCFPHTIPTGLQHGTVTVMQDKIPYEVTTFRTEGTYSDRRRPDEVEFVPDVESDLSRRDFSINAMALDRGGVLIDPFGGQEDLKERKLRCVGNPNDRFGEDALRMVRAIRFAAEYGLTIVESSWQAILTERSRLDYVAMERIRVELERMLGGSAPDKALEMWIRSKLYHHLKRDLGIPSPQWSKLHKHLTEVNQLNKGWIRWCWLWLRLELSPEAASIAMKRLTFANQDRKLVITYLDVLYDMFNWHAALAGMNDTMKTKHLALKWKKTVLMAGRSVCEKILQLLRVLTLAEFESFSQLLLQHAAEWIEEMPIHDLSGLSVNGEDISRLLHKKGPWIKWTLEKLLEETAIHGLSNDKDTLLERGKLLLAQCAEESAPSAGTVPWDPERIRALLLPSSRLVSDIRCFQSVDSTQAEAQRWLSQEHSAEGGLVLAEQQRAGRGRQGKTWFSPAGKGIWLSLILRPRIPTKFQPQLTLLMSVAVCRVLREVGVEVGIKWPNDILAQGKKLAGILLESSQGKDGNRYIICGVGISVNIDAEDYPKSIQKLATSVKEQLGKPVDRTELFIRFLHQVEELLEMYEKEGFQKIKTMWEALSVTIGQKIKLSGGSVSYTALGLSEEGALQVRDENNQIQYIYSGEITHLNSDC